MAYLEDLSEYTYARSEAYRPVTKAVGWLGRGHAFEIAPPSEELLDLLWQYCKVGVEQMRGYHRCEFCLSAESAAHDLPGLMAALKHDGLGHSARRNGDELVLGSAEIRVFGEAGLIYAVPNLIYHYVLLHHYRPPEDFVRAMKDGPNPTDSDYFKRLTVLKLDWRVLSTAR
jgi:hypothetical protein